MLAGLIAALPGCAGWDTWPPTDPVDSVPNRDDAAVIQTSVLALGRVIGDYPPRGRAGQPVAINVPSPLVGKAVYRRIAREVEVEPEVNRLVTPLDQAGLALPIYHVAGVRIRTGKAEIDILRPIFNAGELGRAELTNDMAYEGYTVRLSGGFRPWHVTWVERFVPGIIPTPALNLIDDIPPSSFEEPAAEPAQPEPEGEQVPEMPADDPGDNPTEDPGEG